MTLRQFNGNFNQNIDIGVKGKDPQKDTMFRNKIIQKLEYLIKTSKELVVQDAYKFCHEEINKRSKPINEIVKEIESKIAENNIAIKTLENENGDENPYKMAKRAYENFIVYLKEDTTIFNKSNEISLDGSIKMAENQQIIENQQTPDMQSVTSPLPSLNIDSRSLIENKIITQLSIDNQEQTRQNFRVMITEAIGDASRKTTDKKQNAYTNGVKEALTTALNDMSTEECLYKLADKYEKLSELSLKMMENQIDDEKLDYPKTRYQGGSSAYLNLSTVIRDRLADKEVTEFKVQNLQPLR
jgi:hypothetical protein